MGVQPAPLEKLGGLTWKDAPLISTFFDTPSTFETPEVQFPFSGGFELWVGSLSHLEKSKK